MAPLNPTASLTINVLHEDDALLIISKPALLHSARTPASDAPSVADWIFANRPECIEASRSPNDVGLVNRLDFETSGALVAAKSRESWERIHVALTGGESAKEYLVILQDNLTEPQLVESYLGSASRHGKKVKVSRREVPRFLPAKTVFEPFEAIDGGAATAAIAKTATGRRHQVRAHAAYLGFPLRGDTLYGARSVELTHDDGRPPFLLHAWRMKFTHPISGTQFEIAAPLPEYWPVLQIPRP